MLNQRVPAPRGEVPRPSTLSRTRNPIAKKLELKTVKSNGDQVSLAQTLSGHDGPAAHREAVNIAKCTTAATICTGVPLS